MEEEIRIAEDFCRIRSEMKAKSTLMKFAELKNYSKTVEAVTNCIKLFEFQENVQTYTNVVKSFHKLFKAKKSEELKDMFMDEMEAVLESVENLRQFISPEVTEVLKVLKSAVSLIRYQELDRCRRRTLRTVCQRIHSAENIPAKIHDCMDNLHTLRSLYKNVANRGERTKEIIDSIIKRGKFCFCLKDHSCEITVKYKQGRKMVSHNNIGLSDLRSRAFLLMNAEHRDRNTNNTSRKRVDLERFLLVVDTAFDISSMCIKLKQAGHFEFMCYEDSCEQHKLHDLSMQLTCKYDEWTKSLNFCQEKYYYMNFMHPAQLQQLFNYLYKNHENAEIVLSCLQFINCSFENIKSLKKEVTSLPSKSANDGILQNIAITLQSIFAGYHTPDRPLASCFKEPNITDIVQVGTPYIVALDEESPVVIRTIFALFLNTTNQLPDANQILFCREETTIDEIVLFTKRCTDIPFAHEHRRLFCMANIEMLTNDIQSRFVDILIHLQSGNFLLSVICRGHIHHPFFDQSSDRISRTTPMTILHISGKVNVQSIVRDLNSLNLKKYNVLHIDVGVTPSPSELDSVLFQLIILGHISVGSDAYTLRTGHVLIEISNTVGQMLCNSLPTSTCLKRINIDWNNYYDLKVCMEINSPIQVVCQYLKALDNGQLDRTDIYLTGKNTPSPLKADECRILLEKYFSSAGDMSYTLLQIFLNVLADQLKKLSSSVFFRTSNIVVMMGEHDLPSVKSNLVKVLVESCQEFASRSVQSCRSSQAANLHLLSHESYRDSYSTQALAQRVAGMIRWEDSNHLMILFHQNVQTVSAIYRDIAKVPNNIKCLFESQMKKLIEDFRYKTQRELQDILQMLTRSQANKLSDNILKAMAAAYALIPDNLLKMVLISLRINSMIPVVIMGETGGGKTSLVRYLAEISDVDFELFSIHAGIDTNCILQKIREVNMKALRCLRSSVWLFLDEINTCDHLGLIKSIICYRYFQNEDLAPNLTILAACNPFRLRKHSTIFNSGLQGKVKTDKLSKLAYRVHPLPEALIDYVSDYGSLNEKDETFYISKMVNLVFDGYYNSFSFETLLTNILATSQRFVQAKEETDSCVSLRDVDRCKNLVQWFLKFLQKKRTSEGFTYGIETTAIVLALSVCYHSRFENVETRKAYREKIAHIISKQHYAISSIGVLKIIRDEQKEILDRMTLPSGIAKNTALQENVFVVLICILNKIPIFLVGKPGCSKSLSIQLIRSNLRSESSTSDGIIKVFEKAEKYQQHNEKDVISVVILDEIGLAEISRFNPLKVLHGLLEPGKKQNPNVSVVGISDWALDAAKMNRAIHLSRPDMDFDELKYTGHAISSAMLDEMKSETVWEADDSRDNKHISDTLEMLFDEIAIAYYKYTTERQRFANFHGLRDYYSLMKYAGRCRQLSNRFDTSETDIILKGIARNFGGLPTEMMEIVGIFQESVPNLKHKPIPVTDLIKENLDDNACRHLMLITNGDAVISVLVSHLNDAKRPFEIIIGSRFEDDLSDDYNYRILSRIILCMEQGLVLILNGLESIYGSLYDMLNQNYTVVGNKKYCRIALGHYSNPMCHVHDAFKCIFLVEETKLDYSDHSFLNRFEKQQFRLSKLIDSDDFGDIINEIEEMLLELCHVEGYMFTPENAIPSYNHDLLVSLILLLRKTKKSEILNPNHFFEMAIHLLLWMIPPEVIARAKECKLYYKDSSKVEKIQELYMALPIHQGLSNCLDILLISRSSDNEDTEFTTSSTNGEMLLLYTYNNIHCNIISLFSVYSHQIERLSSFKSEKHLLGQIEDFFSSDKSVLLLQCSANFDGQHLLLSKVIIENIRKKCQEKQKHVCMIIHLDRNVANDQQLVPINFLSGWKIIFIDGLEKPTTTIGRFICSSKYDIVRERRPLNEYIVENLFWAFTRMRFTSKNNTIDNQRFVIDELPSSEVAVSTIEELILNWIERSFNYHNQWCIDVAKNSHELYKSGSLVLACENSIHDVIKSPLPMILFCLLELQILNPALVQDEFTMERNKDWRNIVLSKVYTCINYIPPVTGPECYSCSASFLPLKMPLSALIMNNVNLHKDEFIDIIRNIRIQNDIEQDEDIPFELIL
ncbi:RNF213 [Mytilus coruscus]|uniref:RNF213 n=1 Tax=Mytilus coruscus TaxID=42192 RepID=A0A6J8CQ85_MYTCO|nr:RNF213 [Mytilus coruscus]